MLAGYHPVIQAILGTLFTWGLTAAGSALVFVFSSGKRSILDGSLGFAAGVMTAASYWSLLAPAIEMASESGLYGAQGQWAFVPVAIGFTFGAAFVYWADAIVPSLGVSDPTIALAVGTGTKLDKEASAIGDDLNYSQGGHSSSEEASINMGDSMDPPSTTRRRGVTSDLPTQGNNNLDFGSSTKATAGNPSDRRVSWKRILLLIIAITIHNIPEGLAVGVGFGAIGKSSTATFENARNLAVGIGIQNFPEGLAVSLPLRGSGMGVWKSFWYGQLSGMVEPIAGLLGAVAVVLAEPVLPYALAFAAGAMIYVVVDDIVPEAQTCGNGTLASWGAVIGFVVMMSLDVGLG